MNPTAVKIIIGKSSIARPSENLEHRRQRGY